MKRCARLILAAALLARGSPAGLGARGAARVPRARGDRARDLPGPLEAAGAGRDGPSPRSGLPGGLLVPHRSGAGDDPGRAPDARDADLPRRPRRQDVSRGRSRSHADRRPRPRPSRRRPRRDAPPPPGRHLRHVRRGGDAGPEGGVVPEDRRRAHPPRRRPPPLRPRPPPDRRGPLDAAEDDHVLHARPQPDARDRHPRLRERAGAAAERGHRALDPLSRARDRPRLARGDELHHPAPLGRRLRVRPPARVRVRQRAHRHGPAEGRDPPGAAPLQRRRGDRAALLRLPRPRDRVVFPAAPDPLGRLGAGAAGLRRGDARARSGRSSARRFSSGSADDRDAHVVAAGDPGRLLHRPREPAAQRLGARAGGLGERLPHGVPPPDLRLGPRAGHDLGRRLGRAARHAGGLAPAGRVPDGHGARRARWASSAFRCPAPRSASRPRRSSSGRWSSPRRVLPCGSRRRSSPSSPSSTGTRTARSCRPGRTASSTAPGFVVATGSLHGVGIAIGLVHRWAGGRIALRAAGAIVALAGVFFVWRLFR